MPKCIRLYARDLPSTRTHTASHKRIPSLAPHPLLITIPPDACAPFHFYMCISPIVTFLSVSVTSHWQISHKRYITLVENGYLSIASSSCVGQKHILGMCHARPYSAARWQQRRLVRGNGGGGVHRAPNHWVSQGRHGPHSIPAGGWGTELLTSITQA